MADSLRDRIAAAISAVDDWRGVTDPAILVDAVMAVLAPEIYHHNTGCVCDDCWCEQDGPPISSLRDHVIRAIQRSNTVLYPNEWHPLTDALIAELGLRREDWNEGHSDRHRWVSRWMP